MYKKRKEYCLRGHFRPLNRLGRICLECNRILDKKYLLANPDKMADKSLRHVFGPEAVGIRATMAREQNNMCKICGVPEMELNRRLHLDHDHKTGRFRGLLCKKCNSLLGFVNDNPKILEAAISYLEVLPLAAK